MHTFAQHSFEDFRSLLQFSAFFTSNGGSTGPRPSLHTFTLHSLEKTKACCHCPPFSQALMAEL
jgi:hypothetical protein